MEGQSFDNAFIPGEIVRLLMKCEKYDDPRLPVNMISYGKVMGIGKQESLLTTQTMSSEVYSIERVNNLQ